MIVPKVSCIVLFGSDAGNLGWLGQVDEEGIHFCSLALVSLVPSQWGYINVWGPCWLHYTASIDWL